MADNPDGNKDGACRPIPNWLDRVRIVLVGTSHAGNIGAVARAMKNMGLSRLALVAPQARIDEQARANAKHALEVLDSAVCYDRLDEALEGSLVVWATSARPREMNMPMADVRAAVADIRHTLRSESPAAGDVSILFGAERTGLTNAELLRAQALIEIPANPEYPVLNLSQAVQVVGYELRMAWRETGGLAPSPRPAGQEAPAPVDEIAVLIDRLGALLEDRRYFGSADEPKAVMRTRERLLGRVRLLLNRARPSANELAILHGMLTALGRAPDNESGSGADTAARDDTYTSG